MRVYTGSAWVAAYVNGADYLALSGGTMTGDIAYGDNVKATFGTSADLQVYHDGVHSRISDAGQGELRLMSNGDGIKLQNINGENMVYALNNGAVSLYYDGSAKLSTSSTGINVTGKIEVTGGGSSLFDNTIRVRDDTNDTKISFERSDTGAGGWIGIPSWDADALYIYGPTASNNEIAAKYTNQSWSLYGGGSVRLATSSNGINVTGTVVADGLTVEGNAYFDTNSAADALFITRYGNLEDQAAKFTVNDSTLTVDSIQDEQYGSFMFKSTHSGTGSANRLNIDNDGDISFYNSSNNAKFFWDASAERLGIGTTSPATKLDVAGDAAITNSGHFLVGKTSRDSTNTVGAELKDTGEVMATVNDSVASYLNRKTSHGDIVQFRKDNIAVGGIGSTSGGLYVDFGNWTITESGGSLYFATGGTNKMKLDASGNLDVVGSVNSNATIS
jgi:hypothetical protein